MKRTDGTPLHGPVLRPCVVRVFFAWVSVSGAGFRGHFAPRLGRQSPRPPRTALSLSPTRPGSEAWRASHSAEGSSIAEASRHCTRGNILPGVCRRTCEVLVCALPRAWCQWRCRSCGLTRTSANFGKFHCLLKCRNATPSANVD